MKQILSIVAILLVAISCKNEAQKVETQEKVSTVENQMPKVDYSAYPEELIKVFKAHGGLETWKSMRSMTYQLNEQSTVTDLLNRNILLETDNYMIGGNDGKVWIAQDSTYFDPGRARFYHNLMFYFYAMPFVLSDDGINYSPADSLTYKNETFPGIKISYNEGIGDAPDDNYILYYDPSSYEMKWLAYTVTYGKNEESNNYSFIKYEDWNEVNGLLLPVKLQWYTVKDGKPDTPRGDARVFEKIDVDNAPMDNGMFKKPENGIYVD